MSFAKRALDIVVSGTALVLLSPVLAAISFAIWVTDFHSPFYIAPRAARGDGTFMMVKFRSMVVGADRTGVDSTSAADRRITPVGRFLRRYKLDELPQLWNIIRGDMSLVGPRPQVLREVALYTAVERELLAVRPGLTDLSSIVFADEGEILRDQLDPDLAYNQVIRPWKSRLGLLYVRSRSFRLDLELILLTAVALVSLRHAISVVDRILKRLGADDQTRRVSRREGALPACPPPGATEIVLHR
jgi:lipopolysaccharide/colanic/teichoic acid biosynthesis glycosyltransferase